MKKLKQLISLVMALMMALSCMVFVAGAAEETENTEMSQKDSTMYVEGTVAHINDYMEFYNNQDYYINWARENGYSLFINVPSEYLEIEKERVLGENYASELLTGIATRGLSAPTAIWNIAQKGKYSFVVETAASKIYTNYKFTGKTFYTLTTSNTSNVSSGGTAYGVVGGPKSFSTVPNSTGTSINFFSTSNLTSSPIYFCFNAPAYLFGSIE
ncbi:MAG: hypothetical protein MR419_03350 [Clostridiales bacterium]|nr:hypothetical protein [Clostridiales bacterium]MDY4172781.1 hypothetical protein [Evtepia sp.]